MTPFESPSHTAASQGPARARAHASGIFRATSILGTWAATLAGLAVAAEWRCAYLVGVLPALLVAWVIRSVKGPESWKAAGRAAAASGERLGSLRDLLLTPQWAAARCSACSWPPSASAASGP